MAALVSGGIAYSAESPKAAKPIKVLLVTGAEYHNWRETAPVLAAQLRKDPRMDVRLIEDANFLDSSAVGTYDVIFLNYMNWQVPAPGEAARNNLKKAIADGKGLMLVHFACGAWRKFPDANNALDWPEFMNLAGRVWDPKLRGHDPHGPFTVTIIDRTHPVTAAMESFETTDELYTCLVGDIPIQILATARSTVDGKDYPMAFTLTCGKGRVFHSVLGHDVNALANPATGRLFRRASAWTAGLEPME